ncbi:hypothetical protein MKW94_008728 [Papaver nudicaule]|uniref:Protein kinase domain-containing protein n=1 Tax=Papaver nudicaule TaxID=74823 RepID=A0AA41VPR9_PAPNU|nr:hypothetical protein [Papaver nudicaule]
MKLFAFLILVVLFCFTSIISCDTDPRDLQVLLDFQKGLDNPERLPWPVDNDDPCASKWSYIFCDSDKVTRIEVPFLGLKGTIPPNLNQLSELVEINLNSNQFYGSLPSLKGLSKLTQAHFGLNKFDIIPLDFFRGLHSLRVLDLEANHLNTSAGWQIPSDLLSSQKLEALLLEYCGLVGKIPEWLGTMPNLKILLMSNNRLNGGIPATFHESQLKFLWLNDPIGNGLTGTIEVVGTMRNLESLWLQNNHFTWTIPSSLVNLTSLKQLKLNGNQLSGTIPNGLTKLNLEKMDLSNNYLMGPMPLFKSATVSVYNNSFCQDIPGVACAAEVMALVDFLGDLHYPVRLTSQWRGNNPCNSWLGLICKFRKVAIIHLPSQDLNGTLSPSIWKLESLEKIQLQNNSISGHIPSTLLELRALVLVDLRGNNIEPPIPKFRRSVKILTGKLENNDGPKTGRKSKPVSVTLIVVIFVAVFVLFAILVPLVICFCKRRKIPVMSFKELCDVTDNFAKEKEIGKGGFGTVYKAVLSNGRPAAVKRMNHFEDKQQEVRSHKQFQSEVTALIEFRHRNLVSFYGSSTKGNERLLVYEYMPQGTLSSHLYQQENVLAEPLSWKTRLTIASDVATGLAYLHHHGYIHRDVKSSNILLGDDFGAKVSDFGLTKKTTSKYSLCNMDGTPGYMAPECTGHRYITAKTDVYSFGIVLLELVTGKRAWDETRGAGTQHLLCWIKEITPDKESVRRIVDSAFGEVTAATLQSICDVVELSFRCTEMDQDARPDMVETAHLLFKLAKNLPADVVLVVDDEPEVGVDTITALRQQLDGWMKEEEASSSSQI